MKPDTLEWARIVATFAGAVVVVLVGAWLTQSRERKKWLNDCRKEEYKELINVLTTATMTLMKHHASPVAIAYVRPEKQWDAEAAHSRSLEVIMDRIYVSDELEKMNISSRWNEAVQKLSANLPVEFVTDAQRIRKDLIAAARMPV